MAKLTHSLSRPILARHQHHSIYIYTRMKPYPISFPSPVARIPHSPLPRQRVIMHHLSLVTPSPAPTPSLHQRLPPLPLQAPRFDEEASCLPPAAPLCPRATTSSNASPRSLDPTKEADHRAQIQSVGGAPSILSLPSSLIDTSSRSSHSCSCGWWRLRK